MTATKKINTMPRKLHLFVNQDCNFNCEYCYWHGCHEKQEISYETADKIIKYINDNPSLYDYIIFFGGEPMLATEKIAYLINAIENRDIVYIIMTNGTQHPDMLLNKLKYDQNKHNINFTISYDGLYQDGRAKNSTEVILKHIDYLKENNLFYSIGCILTPYHYRLIPENMIYILDKISNSAIFFRICNLDGEWNHDDLKQHIKDFNKIVDIAAYYTVAKHKSVWLSNRIDKAIEYDCKNSHGSKGNTCQKSLVYTDICGLDGKKYLCEPAYALGCNDYGYLWEANDTYAVEWDKDSRHHNCSYHYCLLYNTQNLEYEVAMDNMRDKYQKRKTKLNKLKNAKIRYLNSIDEEGRLLRLAEDYFRNR